MTVTWCSSSIYKAECLFLLLFLFVIVCLEGGKEREANKRILFGRFQNHGQHGNVSILQCPLICEIKLITFSFCVICLYINRYAINRYAINRYAINRLE